MRTIDGPHIAKHTKLTKDIRNEVVVAGGGVSGAVAGDSVTLTGKSAKWRVATGPVARSGDLESTIGAIEQVPAESQGKQRQLIPIRFIRTNTLTRDAC
jgi:hypothetical protein